MVRRTALRYAIGTVLFDADGVLQRPFATRREAWQRVLGPQQDVDRFVSAVFEAEEAALTGHADFISAFSGILAEWKCEGALQDALAAWTMIEPDDAITDVVSALRRGGVRCCLATNQEPFRARHMSDTLGYARLFDQEFYSCGMGVAKPTLAYFSTIVSVLDVLPDNVLFVDDRQVNVDAARAIGMHAAVFTLDSGPTELWKTMRAFGIPAV